MSNELIVIIGLALNVAVTLVVCTWKLTRIEVAIHATIAEHRAEIDATSNTLERNIGEGMAAIRHKVHDVEMFGRDHYVLKTDYQDGIRTLALSFQTLGDKIEARLLRMENKIDTKT